MLHRALKNHDKVVHIYIILMKLKLNQNLYTRGMMFVILKDIFPQKGLLVRKRKFPTLEWNTNEKGFASPHIRDVIQKVR